MIFWILMGQASPSGTPADSYVTLGSALGVAIAAAFVVIRMQRWSIADLRADREADRDRIDELEADLATEREATRAARLDADQHRRRCWRLEQLVRDLGGDPGP